MKLEEVKVSNTLGGTEEWDTTTIPKEREVDKRRDVCELERSVCVCEGRYKSTMMFRLIRKAVV